VRKLAVGVDWGYALPGRGFFFELVVGISGLGLGLGRFGWPLGLVTLGIVLLVGGLLCRRR
jgi:hypothetical protein